MVRLSPGDLVATLTLISVLGMTGCSSDAPASTNEVLIVDKTFDLKTADPHRELSVTGAMVAKALYSTLLTFNGGDQSTPVPSIAASYSTSEDARRFTFKIRRDVDFSDGNRLTSADVVFSLDRLARLKGAPSGLLTGVSWSTPDAYTIVLTSNDPNPTLPFILTNPALAIVNSTTVRGKPDGFLDGTSAGSGPYILKSFSTFSDIELVASPHYWRAKPFYRKIVIRNMDARAQLAYISSTMNEIALDLVPAQAETLGANRSVRISASPGPDIVFLFANTNAQVSQVTADKHFRNAVREALDYKTMVALMGAGAVQAPGIIPSSMLGALPAWIAPRRDLEQARRELAASGIKDPTVSLGYANDLDVGGLPISALASLVKADLADAGIKVNLAGTASDTAKADFEAGREQMGLWAAQSSAGFSSYLDFLPGGVLGLRAGWQAGSDPSLESLGAQASTTADPATQAQLLQQMQAQLNQEGPFFPLLQPGRVIVSAAGGGAGLDYNPGWSLDLAAVTG